MAHIAGYLHAAAAVADSRKPLFQCEGRSTSAQDASRRVAALAAGLTQLAGMQEGDRVCTAALATDAHLEALLSVTSAGAIAAPLNWRWGTSEAASAVTLVGARLLIADAPCLRFALAAVKASASLGSRGEGIGTLVLLGSPSEYEQTELTDVPANVSLAFAESLVSGCPDASLALRAAPGDTALIVFTSGTTGRPKGVALSHAALHAQSMAKLLVCGYSPSDVYLHTAPLFHIGGLSSALAMLAARARHVFLPRFSGGAVLDAVQRHAVTSFIAVPTMVADLLTAASAAGVATLPSVTRVLVGGGGLAPTLLDGLAALCPAAVVQSAYGMTEAASSMTFTTLRQPGISSTIPDGADSSTAVAVSDGAVFVGQPPPGIELAVYQAVGGSGGPAGLPRGGASSAGSGGVQLAGEGEIVTRGPHVMLGYWEDEAATAAAQLPGGWLRTGDLGRLQHGRLWLLGRAKDMVKSGGENVHAWEVERTLSTHPGIAMAAVVGASDWRLGEAVAAAVVLRPGWRWRGPRCQLLTTPSAAAQRREASRLALEAAQTVVQPRSACSPAGSGALAVSLGSGGGGEREERQAAEGSISGAVCEEDLHSTLLPPRRHGSTQGEFSAHGGLLAVPQPDPSVKGGQKPLSSARRRQLALQDMLAVAAALDSAARDDAASCSTDGSEQGAAQDKVLDGHILQLHCRAAGLAGFKLPRVVLMCDAAAVPPARSALGSPNAPVILPLNSSGKVVKHLLRQLMQHHVQAAAKSDAGQGGSPRARL